MPFALVKKIIDEISSTEFKEDHHIKKIEVGENGDAFLNKDLVRILRYIKLRVPYTQTELFTNFQNFTEEKARIILQERLIDSFWCNIDGANEQNYYNVKKADLQNTKRNVTDFLRIRRNLNLSIPLNILILTLHSYIHLILKNYHFYPVKLKDHNLINVPDDFMIIKEQLEKIIDPSIDRVMKSEVAGWAEREKVDINSIDYENYSCIVIKRIENEAFIAPDGTWYGCCLDANNELIFGNVYEKSIRDIFKSETRRKLIELLKNKQFTKIDGPCKTVNCCQALK